MVLHTTTAHGTTVAWISPEVTPKLIVERVGVGCRGPAPAYLITNGLGMWYHQSGVDLIGQDLGLLGTNGASSTVAL